MSASPFDTPFERLPGRLPVFPLSGALLLPRCRLPLNVFEARYLKMTEAALAGDRLIGMVQPVDINSDDRAPALFPVGCAGRITSFSETDDGRILLILTGVSRFRVVEELVSVAPYRQVVPDWESYRGDLIEDPGGAIDRDRLYASLRVYFEARELDTDWEVLEDAGDENLISMLAMSCPFAPTEKQALLEADSLAERGELMMSLLDMATLDQVSDDHPLH
jgi:Lon protease-like protein